MKKINKTEIKKMARHNRYTTITVCVFLVLLVILFLGYKLLFPNTGTPVYGDRLDGIEDVQISKDELKDLASKVKENENVKKASASLSGKMVNVLITVKKGTSVDTAKGLTDIVIKYFDKDYTAYYDFQVFITNENEDEKGYPIIGYKNNDSKSFSYSSSK